MVIVLSIQVIDSITCIADTTHNHMAKSLIQNHNKQNMADTTYIETTLTLASQGFGAI